MEVIKKLISKNCLLAFFILLTSGCFAQNKIEVSGTVTDSSFNILPGANVQLIAGKDTLIQNIGNDGRFSFLIAPSVNVQLIITHIGFNSAHRYLSALTGTTINITLSHAGTQLAEAVVTEKTKPLIRNSSRGAINFNTQKLDQVPSLLGVPDIIKVLQLMPGVQNSGEANGYLYVRGGDPGHNQMLYNNTPVYGMSHLMGIFPFYNADHVDSIHFDKAGYDPQFGNRLGATIQAVAPSQIPTRFSIKGNVGLAASQITVASPVGKKAGLILSGRQAYANRTIIPVINSMSHGKSIDDLDYSFGDANLTFLLAPSKNHKVTVNAFASGDHFSIAENRMLLNGKIKWDNYAGSAAWDWQYKPNVKLTQEVYFSRYTNNLLLEQAATDVRVKSEMLDLGFRSKINFKLGSIPVQSGIAYANYHVRPQEVSSTQLTNFLVADNTVNAQRMSAWMQGTLQLQKYFSLDFGIRAGGYIANDSKHKIDFRLEPRVSLNFTGDQKLTAYLTYARKCQYLHLITTSSVGFPTDFWIASSQGIPAEMADNFSIGGGYKILPRVDITAGIFYNKLLNQLQYPYSIVQFNEISSFSNDLYSGKGKAYGAEFMVKKSGRLSGWLSYTWSKSSREFDKIDNGKIFPSKFDRRHNLSMVASYKLAKRWSAGVTQIYASGNRFTTPTSWYFINNTPVKEYGTYNNAQMPDYLRTDVSVDFYLKKNSQKESVLNFSVYNLFNVNNPIYVILDVSASKTGNSVMVKPRYKSLYSILPSIGWRFKF